jgi:hypothetical protein
MSAAHSADVQMDRMSGKRQRVEASQEEEECPDVSSHEERRAIPDNVGAAAEEEETAEREAQTGREGAVAAKSETKREEARRARSSVMSSTIFIRGLPEFANEEWIAILIGRTSVATDNSTVSVQVGSSRTRARERERTNNS